MSARSGHLIRHAALVLLEAVLAIVVLPGIARAADMSQEVYVSSSGIYHYVSDCSGMKNYEEMTLGEAIAEGCRPCENCVNDAPGTGGEDAPAGAFSDVVSTTPHANEVLWLADAGISTGFPDGTFRPYANIARCDMAAFLRRLAVQMGVEGAATWSPSNSDWEAFSDVNKGTDHAEDILWLASTGISTGFPDETFRPYANITRCDMAAFLQRLAKLAGKAQQGISIGVTLSDVDSGTPHASDILWLARTGISTGFPDGTFRPYANVTRCDMAAFLYRLASL